MYPRFFGLSTFAVLSFVLSAALHSTPAAAGPVVTVAIGTPPIVVNTPRVSVSVVRPMRPATGWRWVDGHWVGHGHGHRSWVSGYWAPPARTFISYRHAKAVHVTRSRRVVVHRR
jgi:hypothetical protein